MHYILRKRRGIIDLGDFSENFRSCLYLYLRSLVNPFFVYLYPIIYADMALFFSLILRAYIHLNRIFKTSTKKNK